MKATSISSSWPSRTSRLAGLMSRWASPASHSLRMIRQAVVDHLVGDLGLAELDRAGEELGDQQVLPFGGELDHAVGSGAGQAGVAAQPQGVVLLLDQPADGVERLLVLQPPVEQLPAELVPAVGAQVAAGVQLAEQLSGRVALDGDAQWGGAGRAGQAEGRDLGDGQAELVLQPVADGGSPPAGDVQVGGPAAAVADREDLVGGEQAEQGERDGDPDGGADQHVGRGLGAQRDTSQPGQRHHPGRHPACPAAASGPRAPACTR